VVVVVVVGGVVRRSRWLMMMRRIRRWRCWGYYHQMDNYTIKVIAARRMAIRLGR